MFKIRTDLAVELREEAAKRGDLGDGIIFSEEEDGGVRISVIDVTTPEGARQTGREQGHYVTLEFGRLWLRGHDEFKHAVEVVSAQLSSLIGESHGGALVCGLGNDAITADALGPKVVSNLIVTRHLKYQAPAIYQSLGMAEVSAVTPGVLGRTGIESAALIGAVAAEVKPAVVIAVDSLASRRLSRLATTLQLSDTGICPGSGVGNHRSAIDRDLVGAKVIGIGVPMVVDAATLAYDVLGTVAEDGGFEPDERISHQTITSLLDREGSNFFVTPKESDIIVAEMARLVGYSINRAFYPDVGFDEMVRLI